MTVRLSVALLLACLLASAGLIASLRSDRHPARAAADSWTAEYFAGIEPGGAPILTRDEGDSLDRTFDGDAPPAPDVPAQGFSARWTSSRAFADAGLYRFEATTDDGMRIRLDGDTIFDEWYDQPPTTHVVELGVEAGVHEIEVEYFNNYYEGVARLSIDLVTAAAPSPEPTSTPSDEVNPGADPSPVTVREPTAAPARIQPTSTPVVLPTRTPVEAPSPSATPPPAPPASLEPPHIECSWALPDMNSMQPGIQYNARGTDDVRDGASADAADSEDGVSPDGEGGGTGDRDSGHLHDDDMAAAPDRDNDPSNGIQQPCASAQEAAPGQPDGARHMIQIVPNLEDVPEQRRVPLWLAADHPEGIDAIASAWWSVRRPDGSQLATVPGTRLASCDAPGRAGGRAGSMFEAAVHSGQLSRNAVDDDAEGLVSRCRDARSALFAAEFPLGIEEPCGEYRIIAAAHAIGGATAILSTSIDVLCVSALKIDFHSVDWGVVGAGRRKPIAGDTQFLLADDSAPTVKNIGNDGMGLKLRFSPMTSGSRRRIVEFESCFGRSGAELQCINPIRAGVLTSFDLAGERVLCASDPGRIDFALHPALDLPAGVYRGVVTLIGFHVPGECAGRHHLR